MIARGRYLNRQKQLDDTKIPEELRQLRGLKVLVTRHNVDINLRYDQKILNIFQKQWYLKTDKKQGLKVPSTRCNTN